MKAPVDNGARNVESDYGLQVTSGKGSYGIVGEPCGINLNCGNDSTMLDEDLDVDFYELISRTWVLEKFNPSYIKFCEDRGIDYGRQNNFRFSRKSLTT
jgi:hypothetical protein